MAAIPDHVQRVLQQHLIEIAQLFKAPRITIIVRGPDDGNAKGDLVLGNDLPLYVERALRARMIEESKILLGTPQEMRVQEKEPTEGGKSPFQDGGDPAAYQPRRKMK